MPKVRFPWIVLGMCWFTSVVGLIAQQSPPPLMPLIMKDFMITHAQAGLLMTLFSSAALFAIPIGLIVDRTGAKRLGFLSIISLTLGSIIVALSPSFEATLIGRLIEGIGSMSISVIAPAIISQWFHPAGLGTAMGVYGTGLPFATVTAFNLFSLLGLAYGWRWPFYLDVAIGIAVLVPFMMLVRDRPLSRKVCNESPNVETSLRKSLANKEAWKVGAYMFLAMGGWTSFTTWAPTFLNEFRGVDLHYASFLTSLPLIISLPCQPIIGWVSDRLKKRKAILLIGSVLMTSGILIVSESSGLTLITSFAILGVAFALMPGTAFSLAGEASGPGPSGTSFGILLTCANTGPALGPVLVGLIRDLTGSLPYSFAAMSLFVAPSILIACLMKAR